MPHGHPDNVIPVDFTSPRKSAELATEYPSNTHPSSLATKRVIRQIESDKYNYSPRDADMVRMLIYIAHKNRS